MLECDLYPLPHSEMDEERLIEEIDGEILVAIKCRECDSAHFHVVKTEKTGRWWLICVGCLTDIGRLGEIPTGQNMDSE